MKVEISDAPEEIYLVFEGAEPGETFKNFSEVTWCSDKISDNDVKYIRADRVAALEQDAARHVALLKEARQHLRGWHDAPPVAGRYLGIYPDGIGGLYSYSAAQVVNFELGYSALRFRYFGPIPPDPETSK